MGTRGQVKIIADEGEKCSVYLYQHINAYNLPTSVAKIMARRRRWDTPEYLARMIFDEMTESPHRQRLKTTDPEEYEYHRSIDYGIGTSETDGDYLVEVDVPNQRVETFFGDEQLHSESFQETAELGDRINNCLFNNGKWNDEERVCEYRGKEILVPELDIHR